MSTPIEPSRVAERNILLSRFLTRSGDQAWSLAVPIVLMQIFSEHTLPAVIYFFFLMLGGVILTPHVGRYIDLMPRFKLIKIGIALQMSGITFTFGIIAHLAQLQTPESSHWGPTLLISVSLLVIFGLVTKVGENILEIIVASDIVPTIVPAERIGVFNSRFRQIDLITEVTAPLIAGLIMSFASSANGLLGFCIIWIWNFASYIPEYKLLKAAFDLAPFLKEKKTVISGHQATGFWQKLLSGWPEFRRHELFVAMAAYSLLWLSVLSPHGVLLTGFLKNGWKLPEVVIGLFRGLGALFGLIATLLFPVLLKRLGLLKSAKVFLLSQAICVSVALIFFHFDSTVGYYAFLLFVLFSRVGLYGFSLAEGQMRQMYIRESQRGIINGTASSLNNLATMILFAFGMVFPGSQQFWVLVYLSGAAVVTAAIFLVTWRPQLHAMGGSNSH